jgi:hypothetical protein
MTKVGARDHVRNQKDANLHHGLRQALPSIVTVSGEHVVFEDVGGFDKV